MQIKDIIMQVDTLVPNQYAEEVKIKWLGELDSLVYHETIARHEGEHEGFVPPLTAEDELLIGSPYGEQIYPYYLESKIHYYNAEYGKFNNATVMYNNNYARYVAMYERDHKPNRKYRYRF